MRRKILFLFSSLLLLANTVEAQGSVNNSQSAYLDSLYFMVFDRLVETGSIMPLGNCDIPLIDEGYSSFYRSTWMLNEYPADGGWWIWEDPGVPELQSCSWTSEHVFPKYTYLRLLYNLNLQNTYLYKAAHWNLCPAEQAQVRFVRALTAWYLLDLFNETHFTTQPNIDCTTMVSRQDLYTWLENELLALTTLLPQTRTDLYRVDADAAKMLLARLYLNAEVYTGTPQWGQAAQYAQQVMNGQHPLHTTQSNVYSPYQKLFMGNNDTNGAAEEALLLLKQDGQKALSYGGSMFLISSTRDWNHNMPYYGISSDWRCWRAGYRLLQAFASSEQLASVKGTEYTIPVSLGDDRATFYADKNYPTPTMTNNYSGGFEKTWSVNKFTNRYSIDPMDGPYTPGSSAMWPDTDIPLMRSAEAWLTYAEAQYRLGNTTAARNAIADLRNRAHATTPATISLDYILDEWLREFHTEGRRRVDLVRFQQFASPNATRTWEGHENVTNTAYNTFPTLDVRAEYSYLLPFNVQVPEPTEGIDEISNDLSPIPHKVHNDGKVYIIRGDHTYTLTGQEVK